MGLFDSLQNLLGGITEQVHGSLGDVAGGITDNQALQDIQEQATAITDGTVEQAQNVVDDISQHFQK